MIENYLVVLHNPESVYKNSSRNTIVLNYINLVRSVSYYGGLSISAQALHQSVLQGHGHVAYNRRNGQERAFQTNSVPQGDSYATTKYGNIHKESLH
jgi:hypothetical protein